MRRLLLALVLVLPAVGWSTAQGADQPSTPASTPASPSSVSSSPASLPGDVTVSALDLTDLKVPDQDKTVRFLPVRLTIENRDRGPWVIDSRQQKLILAGEGQSPPVLVNTDRHDAPLITVGPNQTRIVDLYYALPAGMQQATTPPTFDLAWQVQTPDRLVAQRTNVVQGAYAEGESEGAYPANAQPPETQPMETQEGYAQDEYPQTTTEYPYDYSNYGYGYGYPSYADIGWGPVWWFDPFFPFATFAHPFFVPVRRPFFVAHPFLNRGFVRPFPVGHGFAHGFAHGAAVHGGVPAARFGAGGRVGPGMRVAPSARFAPGARVPTAGHVGPGLGGMRAPATAHFAAPPMMHVAPSFHGGFGGGGFHGGGFHGGGFGGGGFHGGGFRGGGHGGGFGGGGFHGGGGGFGGGGHGGGGGGHR